MDIIHGAKVESSLTVEGVTHASLPVGVIMPYAGVKAPPGWLLCDGRAIPDEPKYQKLRALMTEAGQVAMQEPHISTPNLVARTVVGAASDKAVVARAYEFAEQAAPDTNLPADQDNLGLYAHRVGGSWQHALTEGEMPRHQHSAMGESTGGWWPFGDSPSAGHKGSFGGTDSDNYYYNTSWTGGWGGGWLGEPGDGPGVMHTNTQPFLALHYIIKF